MRTKKDWSPHTHLHTYTDLAEHSRNSDDRCTIGKCVHTRRPTQSLNFHCRQTTEGKVASGAKAAVTQQSRVFLCKKENGAFVEMLVLLNQIDFKLLFSLSLCPPPKSPTPSPFLALFLSSLLPPPLTCIALSTSRSPSPLQASEKEKESPVELTERCFRELLGRAAYGNIKNAVTPVLM